MYGVGREALPAVRESLQGVREWPGDPPGCPGVIGRLSRMSRSGRQALSDVRESLPDVREWSGSPPGCPGVVE